MRFYLRRQVRRTTLISFGSAAFLAGIGLVRVGWGVPLAAGMASVVLLGLCYKRIALVAVPAAIAIGLLLGLARGADVDQAFGVYRSLTDQKVTLIGTVSQDATYGKRHEMDFRLDNIRQNNRQLPGQVRVTTFDPVEPRQGDVVVASGKLKPGFGNYQATLYFSSVHVVAAGDSPIVQARRLFSTAILNVLPEPQASLALGILLGIKSQLPDSLNEQLKLVGLTHVVVASGYNLTILVRAARRLLAHRSKYQSTAAAVLLMVGFVGVTGFSPSMTRAALVTSLSLAAWYYGRVIHPVLLLLFSAAVTAAISPQYVWGDVGWYLSFLAFGGVMLGGPLLTRRLFGRREPPQLAQIALETLCAEVATMPLMLFVFGKVSVVAFAANLLAVPLVPLAMLASFVGGLGPMLLPGVGSWLALPAQWLLSYMTGVISWLASVPWAQQSISLPPLGMVAIYAFLIGIGYVMWRKLHYDYLSKSVVE